MRSNNDKSQDIVTSILLHTLHRAPFDKKVVLLQVCGLIKGGCSAVIGVGDNFYGALLHLKALKWTLKAWNGPPLWEQNHTKSV
jgi:hypothetical protein